MSDTRYAQVYFGVLAALAALLIGLIVAVNAGGAEPDNSDLVDAIMCDSGNATACVRHYERMRDQ